MSVDDLSSIPGLQDKHVQALDKQLHITSFRELAAADSGAIHRALSRFRPRPGLNEIARWQDQARRKLGTPAMDQADWHNVRSFAVVFSQRRTDGGWERQIEAERTEVEAELPLFVSPGWDGSPVCDWMLDQLPQHDEGEEAPGGTTTTRQTRGQLRIDSAAVTDATGTADLIQAGELVADPLTELVPPARATIIVTGAQPGHGVLALARIRASGESAWSSAEPVTAALSGRAELNLSPLGTGEHDIQLLAWVPDATAYLVSMRLPTVTVKPVAG